MNSQSTLRRLLTAAPAAAALLAGAPALAAPNVVYVSGAGNDANACDTINQPCRTLQAAHDKAVAGGTVVVVDGGNYKPLVIRKSIAILNEGSGVADIEQTAAGGDAILIAAGANDVVQLRGLSLDGAGLAANGVRLRTAASLHIADCVARRFAGAGFLIAPTSAATFVLDNATGSANSNGVDIAPAGGAAKGVVENSRFFNNKNIGLRAYGGATAVTVYGGFASENANGVVVAGGASLMARDATSSNNRTAGFAATDKSSILRIAHSVASGNATGVSALAGGQAESYADNNLRGNGAPFAGAFLAVATQ
jgi:hypothetical protein